MEKLKDDDKYERKKFNEKFMGKDENYRENNTYGVEEEEEQQHH